MTDIYDTTLKMHNATHSATSHTHACTAVDKPEGTHMARVLDSAADYTPGLSTDSKPNLNSRRSDAEENFPPKQDALQPS